MTKVCHMTSAHSSNDVRIFAKECTSLANLGYEVYLVARGESRKENGVNVVGLGQPSGGRLSRMTTFANKVYKKALELDADIYHLHDPELLPYGKKLKKKGKRVIFDSHENTLEHMEEKEWIPIAFRKTVAKLYVSYATKNISCFDAVISVTPHICDSLKNINSNTYLVTNYPLISEAEKCANYIPEKKEGKTLVFAGGVGGHMGHGYIIKALSQVGDVTYNIWGDASDEYSEYLSELPGFAKTRLCGTIPHMQVADELKKADIGMAICQYSKNVGGKIGTLGVTKLFEYMLAGIPVICTDFTLWREIIDKYKCGICVGPTNISEIANAINYLLNHPEEAVEMGQNGYKAVLKEYNWNIEEEKLKMLYLDLSSDN